MVAYLPANFSFSFHLFIRYSKRTNVVVAFFLHFLPSKSQIIFNINIMRLIVLSHLFFGFRLHWTLSTKYFLFTPNKNKSFHIPFSINSFGPCHLFLFPLCYIISKFFLCFSYFCCLGSSNSIMNSLLSLFPFTKALKRKAEENRNPKNIILMTVFIYFPHWWLLLLNDSKNFFSSNEPTTLFSISLASIETKPTKIPFD